MYLYTIILNFFMENNIKEIQYNGETFEILQYLSETNSQFNERIKYIQSYEKKNISFKEAVRLSKIWYCYKFKKCKYNNIVF